MSNVIGKDGVVIGKDGKEFDKTRWVEWAVRMVTRPNLYFRESMLNGSTGGVRSKRIRVSCPKCFQVFKGGAQLKKHLKGHE